jgi:hypothetical protein
MKIRSSGWINKFWHLLHTEALAILRITAELQVI